MKIEEISHILFDSAAEGLVVADVNGVIKIVNASATNMFGYNEGELQGKSVDDLIPNKLRNKHIKHRDHYNKNPTRRTMGSGMNLVGLKKDGLTFPVEISLNHFTYEGQQMALALISDITKRKQADDELLTLKNKLEEKVIARTKQLEESQQLYQLIAQNFPNGVISVLDENLNYVFVDGIELKHKSIEPSSLVGTSYLDRLPKEKQQKVKKRLLEVLDGKDLSMEIELDGRVYLIHAVGLPNAHQKITRILKASQNITSLKEAEENIQRALHKEKSLNELKSRFVSMASHEFRTPLTSILNATSLLSRYIGKVDAQEKQHKHVDRIKTSVQHLTTILNDFLSLDKLDAGKVDLHYSTFNIEQFTNEIVADIQEISKEGQIITYQHKGETEHTLDQQLLKNIYYNLLSNAVKYSTTNSAIKLNTSFKNQAITIQVKDNGVGIPEEEQGMVFSRFFRAQNATNIQGTGLGLNIVKKYVELVGGIISFKSEQNKGTTFTVVLPTNNEASPKTSVLL